ncbi:P-loop containing nucleoside triphosphate hydrolase protein [Xylariaceae sp. FL0016]|nr:P-loop containing nucleoside triphosphate hydrolase protein [Xylariaceae sp. FL0016]
MYSRYVPPSSRSTLHTAASPAREAPSDIPSKPHPTAYARYVPPSKAAKTVQKKHLPSQRVVFEEDYGVEAEQPPSKKVKLAKDDSLEKSEKPKKAKKDGKPVLQPQTAAVDNFEDLPPNDDDIGSPNVINGDSNGASLEFQHKDEPAIVDKPKKEKKSKREKRKKRKDTEDSQKVEDDTPKHHKSVLEKAAKSLQKPTVPEPDNTEVADTPVAANNDPMDIDTSGHDQDTPLELHGLEPIPQPVPVVPDTGKVTYETLPPWLAEPIRVSSQSTAPFTSLGSSEALGVSQEVAENLKEKGYKEAFAVQTGVIPLLLPQYDKAKQADVLVSAATGSGKTLAYTLPMIRDISLGNRYLTRLRALIVVPTRELVKQVYQVCDQCAGAFALDGARRRPRIAMAMGSQSLDQEQSVLVERVERYAPEEYQERVKRLRGSNSAKDDDHEDEGYNTDDEEKAAMRKKEDHIQTLPDYVVDYKSKVDVLVCTPGRLVEHIKSTPGFDLTYVRWLVADEADKLLGQDFQQWLDVVIPELQSKASNNGARKHKQSNFSGVRKVILSATMTRDLDQLEGLKLQQPKLVVLEGAGLEYTEDGSAEAGHALPALLEEAALKISDPNLKPLFLLDLLQSNHLFGKDSHTISDDNADDQTSSSGSDTDSDSESESESDGHPADTPSARLSKDRGARDSVSTVLIFTRSNEIAMRLSRLLSLLAPTYKPLIGTLTSTTPYTSRRDTIRSFSSGKLRILVASDLVARGIDLPSLDHVINYDMPSSVASYVHRVGRTARAGKPGKAWTLFTNPEARWFWNEVASPNIIQRRGSVDRIRVTEEKEDAFDGKVAAYEAALQKLGEEASQSKSK